MAKSPDWSTFHIEALTQLVVALGLQVPSGATKEQLVSMINDVEKMLPKEDFLAAVAAANGVAAQGAASKGPTLNSASRSMSPGVSIKRTLINGVGRVGSETWNPPTPLEYGRTVP
jgi:hypothetical protein